MDFNSITQTFKFQVSQEARVKGGRGIWWLLLCVKLTRSQGAQVFGETVFDVSECFGMRLAFESVDWVKQIAFSGGSGYHSILWGPQEDKKVGKGAKSLCAWLSRGIGLFLPLYRDLYHGHFWVYGFWTQMATTPLAFLVLPPAYRGQIVGPLGLNDHMS